MSSKDVQIPKLKGQSNFEVWKLRILALLVEKDLYDAINHNNDQYLLVTDIIDRKARSLILLSLEDGPLLQVKNCNTAKSIWELLDKLYSSNGFSSEFLICKEFFETTLSRFNSMEDYLNRIKYLADELKSKNIELPNQVIIAWVLNNLSNAYES